MEIKEKLERKEYPEDIVEEILRYLEEKNFVNDEEFAREWARACIRKGKSYRRIKYELKRKGVKGEITEKVLDQIFHEVDEKEMASRLLYKRRYLPLPDNLQREERLKELGRIYRFLYRRGFSYSVIKEIMDEVS